MAGPAVDPPVFEMSITEEYDLPFDASANLGPGQSVASATSSLTKLPAETPQTLSNMPVVLGNIVTQFIDGPTDLPSVGRYRLTINFNAAPSSNRPAMELILVVIP